MAQPKFKAGATVTVLRNDLQPQFVGKKVKIKKAFQITNDDAAPRFAYRLDCNGETLKGITLETDIQ